MMDLFQKSALSLAGMLRRREIGPVELTKEFLSRIAREDGNIHSYLTLSEEAALRKAAELERIPPEDLPPLAGVPIALKDNISTAGTKTTCGSKMLETYIPPYNATVVDHLSNAGIISLGKLNMDEFAMGGSTETSFFGVTRNPWDTGRVPGGSSGGAAAAVATGLAPFALGSDTGGSIRQPCSFCGVSGIRPTYGTVSRFGLIAHASSMDQIGPIARTIEDCAAVLALLQGKDPRDATTVAENMDFSQLPQDELTGLRVGLPRAYFSSGLEGETGQAILSAAKRLEGMGAVLSDIDLELTKFAVPAYYILACAEASSNLARYDSIRYGHRTAEVKDLQTLLARSRSEGFGQEVQRRILMGTLMLSADYYDRYYRRAEKARQLIRMAFDRCFQEMDLLLAPCAPTTAYPFGERMQDPLQMYQEDIYTVPASLAGLPAAALPCGFDQQGLPIGMQLIGKRFRDPLLARVGAAFQRETDYHLRRPGKGASGNVHS